MLDKWYLWPDYYMVSADETAEFEEALKYRSDDFEVVYVLSYDETGSPEYWLTKAEYEDPRTWAG